MANFYIGYRLWTPLIILSYRGHLTKCLSQFLWGKALEAANKKQYWSQRLASKMNFLLPRNFLHEL